MKNEIALEEHPPRTDVPGHRRSEGAGSEPERGDGRMASFVDRHPLWAVSGATAVGAVLGVITHRSRDREPSAAESRGVPARLLSLAASSAARIALRHVLESVVARGREALDQREHDRRSD